MYQNLPRIVVSSVSEKVKNSPTYTRFQNELINDWDIHPLLTDYLWKKGIQSSLILEDIFGETLDIEEELLNKLADLTESAELIINTINKNGVILIYGDYDADGISSTATLWKYIYHVLGYKNVYPFIPDRKADGYGLNVENVINQFKKNTKNNQKKEKLLITVDCGIRDQEIIHELKKYDSDLAVIITDHHSYPDSTSNDNPVPAADYFIHPLHTKNSSQINPKEICGAVVAWALSLEITRLKNTSKLDNYWGLEYATIGTICDLMPLRGLNRKIVKLGLKKIESTNIFGIKELINISSQKRSNSSATDVSADTIGYQVGPRINAAGRIGDPLIALKLLVTNNQANAKKLAVELEQLNKERQKLTSEAIKLADSQVNESGSKIIIVKNDQWEEGIVGLIAGKLQRKYWKPTIALTKTEDNNWVGSARSNPGINITQIITSQSESLVKFGGHSQAAGLTIKEKLLEDVIDNFIDYSKKSITDEELIPLVEIDINLNSIINKKQELLKLNKDIEKFKPFGKESEKPTIYLKQKLENIQYIGSTKQHSKTKLGELDLLMFNQQISENRIGTEIEFIGELGVNEWRDQLTPQIILNIIK